MISETKSRQPQLYFLSMEAGDFESSLLIFNRRVRHNLAELFLESIDIAEDFTDDSDSALTTSTGVRVDWQVTLVGTLNIEGKDLKSTKWLVNRDKDVL